MIDNAKRARQRAQINQVRAREAEAARVAAEAERTRAAAAVEEAAQAVAREAAASEELRARLAPLQRAFSDAGYDDATFAQIGPYWRVIFSDEDGQPHSIVGDSPEQVAETALNVV